MSTPTPIPEDTAKTLWCPMGPREFKLEGAEADNNYHCIVRKCCWWQPTSPIEGFCGFLLK